MVGALVFVAGGGACGGEPAEEQVRSAWESASHAAADGRATEFCAMVSAEGRQEIATRAGMACEDAVRLLASRLGASERAAVRAAKVTRVEVRGDEASVTYRSSAALAELGFTGRTSLRRIDGRWMLRGV